MSYLCSLATALGFVAFFAAATAASAAPAEVETPVLDVSQTLRHAMEVKGSRGTGVAWEQVRGRFPDDVYRFIPFAAFDG